MIIARAQRLTSGVVEIKVHWVLGHLSVEGNEQANTTAKEAADGTGTRWYAERFDSLAHINRTISERK